MSEIEVQETSLKPLLDKMVAAKQLSSVDAELLLRQSQSGAHKPLLGEADVLRWLAQEYDLTYTTLEDVELDRQLISLFPARILLKEELLPQILYKNALRVFKLENDPVFKAISPI